jgi:hypothetical protein
MTYREQTAYDMGYQAGKHDAVVHGEWIEHDLYICNSDDEPVAKIGTIFICSVCGREENHKELYCHCGAKMDGKDGEGK